MGCRYDGDHNYGGHASASYGVLRTALICLSAKLARKAEWEERIKAFKAAAAFLFRRKRKPKNENELPIVLPNRRDIENAELLQWAWENGRLDILAQFGIILPPDFFEP